MRKNLILLLISISLLFSASVVVSAQTTIKDKPAQQWHCLQNTYCGNNSANCTTKGEAGIGAVMGHRVKLTTRATDLPARNQPTGVFVCIGTKEGNICTSGDGAFDKQMLGYNGLAKLGQVAQYEFQGLFRSSDGSRVKPSSIVSNSKGKLSNLVGKKAEIIEPLEMQDYTPVSLPRKWLALNLIKPKNINIAGLGGEQQGTFTFEGALGKCKAISWDPYGIVFDSQSLEPVPGVKVTLNKKRADGRFTLAVDDDIPSILNPITTVEDGQFEMYVPDGTYRLDIEKAGFTFPSTAKLNPNYTKIYSDIYRGEDIIEKGKTEHRDVPIDSKTTPFRGPVKIIAYAPLLDKGTNTMIIQGKVSHPLTKVNIYGKKPSGDKQGEFVRTKLLMSLTADKAGEFDIRYEMNKLGPSEIIGDVEFVKPDYLGKQVDTPTIIKNDTLVVEPILNHLEGYAYDQNGKPIPNAKVAIYLDLSSESAHETIADENGFYRVSSEYIPPMAYNIKYTGPNGTSTVTTSKFIVQNAKYLETQGENLFEFKDIKGKTFTQGEREKFLAEDGQVNQTSPSEEEKTMVPSKKASPDVLPIIIILVFLGLGAVAAAVYFMKKNKSV
jgi:hypothetical protein